MQQLTFSYQTSVEIAPGVARFDLTLSSDEDRVNRRDILMMIDFINLFMKTLKGLHDVGPEDVEKLIQDLMKREDGE